MTGAGLGTPRRSALEVRLESLIGIADRKHEVLHSAEGITKLITADGYLGQHGARAIVIARFVPTLRTFVPFIAGVAQMSYRRYLAYNLIGKHLLARKPVALILEEMAGQSRLKRVLGPFALTALGVGAIIGTGIFVLTGVAAHERPARR